MLAVALAGAGGACGGSSPDGAAGRATPTTTTTMTGAASTQGPGSSAKIADALAQAGAKVQAARARGASDLGGLSTPIVHVRANGDIEVAIHATRVTGSTESSELRGLGAEVVSNTTTPAVPGSPPASLIVAWVPADRLAAVAALPWIGALTPPSYGQAGG
jgi:hypothetical protein